MSEKKIEKYVIFDTDGGTDDAWALLMLLQAEKHLKNIKLLAITCVHGNTTIDNVIKNTYHILRLMDRSDIPIYKGATEPLIERSLLNENFHGVNGMGNVDFWPPEYPTNENALVRPESAMQIIRDLAMQYPNKISLIGVGPLTNIALAVKIYPEIKDTVKDIHLMGGNWKGRGNETSCAEFNFYSDAEAAHIVLSSFKCPIVVVPWEPIIEGAFSLDWRFDVFKDSQSPAVKLLNEADKYVFRNFDIHFPCDAFLTAAYLFSEECIEKKNFIHATVELQGVETRGQMVLDHRRERKPNVTIIEQLNVNEIKNKMVWTGTA